MASENLMPLSFINVLHYLKRRKSTFWLSTRIIASSPQRKKSVLQKSETIPN